MFLFISNEEYFAPFESLFYEGYRLTFSFHIGRDLEESSARQSWSDWYILQYIWQACAPDRVLKLCQVLTILVAGPAASLKLLFRLKSIEVHTDTTLVYKPYIFLYTMCIYHLGCWEVISSLNFYFVCGSLFATTWQVNHFMVVSIGSDVICW